MYVCPQIFAAAKRLLENAGQPPDAWRRVQQVNAISERILRMSQICLSITICAHAVKIYRRQRPMKSSSTSQKTTDLFRNVVVYKQLQKLPNRCSANDT